MISHNGLVLFTYVAEMYGRPNILSKSVRSPSSSSPIISPNPDSDSGPSMAFHSRMKSIIAPLLLGMLDGCIAGSCL